jgi:hypothetical protein
MPAKANLQIARTKQGEASAFGIVVDRGEASWDRFDCIGEIGFIINSNLLLILKKLSKSKDPT